MNRAHRDSLLPNVHRVSNRISHAVNVQFQHRVRRAHRVIRSPTLLSLHYK